MHPQHAAEFLRSSDALLQADRYRDARDRALRVFASADRVPGFLVPLCQRLHAFNECGRALFLISNADPRRIASAADRTELASLASRCGDQALADRWIEHALDADPLHAPAQYLRGVVAMFRGDMPQARFALTACIAIAPDFAQAHWVLSTLPHDGSDADAPARIRASLARSESGGVDEAYLRFALHNALHAGGRHAQAWDALERGCALRRVQAPHDAGAAEALFAGLQSLCTPAFLEPAATPGDAFTPVFIVGMHRSGTTLLERILGGHPLVADGGESHAFTAQLDLAADHKTDGALDRTTLERLREADFAMIGANFLAASRWRARGRPFLTEKLPMNLLNAGLIAKALPQAKLVRVVRDPMDTCFSNLRTFFAGTASWSSDQRQLAGYFLRCERWAEHLHRAMPGRMLDVAYADLVADTEATARRVFDFCGLPFAPQALAIENSPGAVATASAATVRAGILRSRDGAWNAYAPRLQPMRDALSAMQ